MIRAPRRKDPCRGGRPARTDSIRHGGSRPLTTALQLARCADLEIFHLPPGLYCSDQPSWLLPAAGPGFGGLRIAILWKDPRILAARPTVCVALRSILVILPSDDIPAAIEHLEAPFKLPLFRRDPHGQDLADLFVERPEVIERHRLQIDLLHRILQPCNWDFVLVGLMSYNRLPFSARAAPWEPSEFGPKLHFNPPSTR